MDDEKRKELLARRAAREKAAEAEKQEREDLILELEDRFSTPDMIRGRHFEIANTREGVLAVKRSPAMVWAAWTKHLLGLKPTEAPNLDAIINTVVPSLLHPTPEIFRTWCKGTDAMPGCEAVATAGIDMLNHLHIFRAEEEAGK